MPRFLGLKSYLTTNRSNITKQQAIRERRSRLSKWGVLREEVAGRLKCPLCFGVPCFVGAAVLLVLVGIYVTTPHLRGKYTNETSYSFRYELIIQDELNPTLLGVLVVQWLAHVPFTSPPPGFDFCSVQLSD